MIRPMYRISAQDPGDGAQWNQKVINVIRLVFVTKSCTKVVVSVRMQKSTNLQTRAIVNGSRKCKCEETRK